MVERVSYSQIERSWRMRSSVARLAAVAAASTVLVLAFAASAFGATITAFTPISGSIDDGGTVVTITGTGLLGATGVKFNGVSASWFQVGSDSTVYARIPSGATSGPITVAAADGTTPSSSGLGMVGTNGGNFTIFAPQFTPQTTHNTSVATTSPQAVPVIASFTPTSGAAGSKVTMVGKNFKGATGVKIGGATAKFVVASGTKIVATVPSGAKSGHLSVTTSAGTGTSKSTFTKK
jgi:hypothetical protein